MTNEEEILSENMIEEVLIKVVTYKEGAGPITDEEEKKIEDLHESTKEFSETVQSEFDRVNMNAEERNSYDQVYDKLKEIDWATIAEKMRAIDG
jgi:phosphomannomutase